MTITGHSVFQAINAVRAEYRLPKLNPDAALVRAAQAKADDMVAREYFAHRDPDGRNAYALVRRERVMPGVVGENLARRYDDLDALVAAWTASHSHLNNITYYRFTRTGIAIAQGKDGVYVVQLFSN